MFNCLLAYKELLLNSDTHDNLREVSKLVTFAIMRALTSRGYGLYIVTKRNGSFDVSVLVASRLF